MHLHHTRAGAALASVALVAAAAGFSATTAGAAPACATRVNNTTANLLECVEVEGVRAHQQAFQDIADANGSHSRVRVPRLRRSPSTTWRTS